MSNYIEYKDLFVMQDSEVNRITAKVFLPTVNNGDFEAVVEIGGLVKSGFYRVYGLDGVQAMLLGIQMARNLLLTSQEFKERRILLQEENGEMNILEAAYLEV